MTRLSAVGSDNEGAKSSAIRHGTRGGRNGPHVPPFDPTHWSASCAAAGSGDQLVDEPAVVDNSAGVVRSERRVPRDSTRNASSRNKGPTDRKPPHPFRYIPLVKHTLHRQWAVRWASKLIQVIGWGHMRACIHVPLYSQNVQGRMRRSPRTVHAVRRGLAVLLSPVPTIKGQVPRTATLVFTARPLVCRYVLPSDTRPLMACTPHAALADGGD